MTGAFLNVFECIFENTKIEVMKTEYIDKEAYKKLREENKDFYFYRDGTDIYFWNNSKDYREPKFEFKKVHMELVDYPYIFKRILSNGISNFFKEKGMSIRRDKYTSTIEMQNTNNNFAKDIPGVVIYRLMLLDTFYSYEQKILGITLSTRLKYDFNWNKDTFIQNGIDIKDLKTKEDKIIPNKKAVSRFIESRNIQDKCKNIIDNLQNISNTYVAIDRTFEFIEKHLDEIFLHKDLKLKKIEKKCLPYSDDRFKLERLVAPSSYYYNDTCIKGKYRQEAIKEAKPFTFEDFNNQVKKISVVFPKNYEGIVGNFLVKLQSKLKDIFYVDVAYNNIAIENSSLEAYKSGIYDNIVGQNNSDMVILFTERKMKTYNIKNSPYHFCKAKLISHMLTSQEILVENIKNNNEFILNNIALSIYAKLGGIPWTVEKIDTQKTELIIGISSSFDRNNKRIFGFSQVFEYNGRCLVTECLPLATNNDYFNDNDMQIYAKEFQKNLYKTLTKILSNIDSEVRLIFHVNKSPSSKYEIKAINDTLQEFKNIKITYAIVHLNYYHNFRLFNNQGNNNTEKGTYISIDKNKTLLTLVNNSIKPLLIDIDYRSTFIDKDYITKQVYWFCNLSFRSMLPSKIPVTMLYPYLVTKLINELKEIDNWDYNVLEKIGKKLWFI